VKVVGRIELRLRGYPQSTQSQERVEVGSVDEEASPPRGASPPTGSARVVYEHLLHLLNKCFTCVQ